MFDNKMPPPAVTIPESPQGTGKGSKILTAEPHCGARRDEQDTRIQDRPFPMVRKGRGGQQTASGREGDWESGVSSRRLPGGTHRAAGRGRPQRGALPTGAPTRPPLREGARGLPPSAAPPAAHLLRHESAQLHAALLVPARHQLQGLGQAEPQLRRHPAAAAAGPGAGGTARGQRRGGRGARSTCGGHGTTNFRPTAVTGSVAAPPRPAGLQLPACTAPPRPRPAGLQLPAGTAPPPSPAAGAVRERSEALPLARGVGSPRVRRVLGLPGSLLPREPSAAAAAGLARPRAL